MNRMENNVRNALLGTACAVLLLAAPVAAADTPPCEEAVKRQEEAIALIQKEKTLLEEKLKALECAPTKYWAKTKALVSRKEADKGEKSFLAASIEGLKNRAGGFNGKLRLFEDTARKDLPLIKNLAAYDGLARELGEKARVAGK